jgi:pimeloyl-ACP methyl ester carboxylesterase
MKNVLVNGLLTSYREQGKGKVVLVLPGWRAERAMDDLADGLSRNFRVIQLDFPGFGESEAPKEPWGVSDFADFTAKFLEKLGIDEIFAVIGHSFGGRVLLKAEGFTDFDAKKLVFIDSAGVCPKKTLKQRVFHLGRPLRKLPGAQKVVQKVGSADYLATSGALRETFKRIINEDLTREMTKITQPSLLIWGKNDTDTPVSDAEVFKAKILHSELKIVPEAGHYVFLDQPKVVLAQIKEFLG